VQEVRDVDRWQYVTSRSATIVLLVPVVGGHRHLLLLLLLLLAGTPSAPHLLWC
jgi:hypothetical protein